MAGTRPGQPETVSIQLSLGPRASPERLADATAKLRRQLLQLEVRDVSLVSAGPAPDGARAGDALEVGALEVAIDPEPDVLESLGHVLSGWMSARNDRSAVVHVGGNRIELTGAPGDDRERLRRLFEDAPEN